ncbi:MAG: hypothetical protein EP298_07145 [Gammaproteobacteria bacterium]|nr:MAG: hypothetical protein EP298_07145 [Gammaproteobacteria bacterium]UTW42713.1 type VI secretion system domain-containing protein [bacterium SCSIO 12844]
MDLESVKQSVTTSLNEDQIGENCRDNERYTKIKTLLSKKNNPNADEASINWAAVSQLSSEILAKESKDLLVACYLAIGLLNTDDIKGLTVGIEVINQMLEIYWPKLYPPLRRINGRWSAFVWLQEQLTDYLENLKTQKAQQEVQPLLDGFTKFDKLLASISDDAPNFLPFIKQFEQIIAPEQEKVEVVEATNGINGNDTADAVTESSLSIINTQAITNLEDAKVQFKNMLEAIEGVAEYFYSPNQENSKYIYYRLSRLALWQGIEHLPEYDEQYKTKVPPPDKEQLKQLQLLQDASNDQGVIRIAEEWVKDNPYWFDLHFSIYQSMINLGNLELEASEIKSACMMMISRFPKLLDLTFSNGLSMISEDMKHSFSFAVDESSDTQKVTDGAQLSEEEAQLLEALVNLKKQNKAKRLESLAKLMPYLSSDINQSLKIQLIITMVDQLMKLKKTTMLKSYVKLLEDKYNYFHLDQWDKKQAAQVLIAIIDAKKMLKEDMTEALMQLAQIDLDAAISIKED